MLTDDVSISATSSRFLWAVFTRFDPASDIYAAEVNVREHHLCYRGPIAIDARVKPRYPAEVACDPETARRVDRRWGEYFPKGI